MPTSVGRRSAIRATDSSTVINADFTAKQSSLSWTIVSRILKPGNDRVHRLGMRDDNVSDPSDVVQVHHRNTRVRKELVARHSDYPRIVRMERWASNSLPKNLQFRMLLTFEPLDQNEIAWG